MIIEIIMCDHCDRQIRGIAYESYTIGGAGPVLHIGACCWSKPFRAVRPSKRGAAIGEVVRMALGAQS